ncbi:hypothetical protein ALC53_06916 [Atta colombica]|uniref:Uncharacterized protein n=1 Tax=Atta colombica TaxID=520822 RepID=A0A195BDU6_9HYME|nr:hypothetical protein ALC53_06916 [Atta colombica]
MQQARLANAIECKAEVGLRAIAVQMGVQLSNEALHLTTVYWRSWREFVRNPTSAHRSANNSREMLKKNTQTTGKKHPSRFSVKLEKPRSEYGAPKPERRW